MMMCKNCETDVGNKTQHDINKNKRILFPNHFHLGLIKKMILTRGL
jgi:hypothetical protein